MHCQRCGTPNEPGDRFCSSCGAALRGASKRRQSRSLGQRAKLTLGTTRKAQLISVATAVALVVAVVAFIELKPKEDTIPRDAYTIAADRLCIEAKREIVALERRYEGGGKRDASAFARELVPIISDWRSEFRALAVPSDRTDQAQQLGGALLAAEVQVGGLARVAAQEDARKTLASARQADAASAAVEEAASALGLSHCAEAAIGFSPKSS